MKSQNNYGVMFAMDEKIELVSTEYITDYFVFKSVNGKMFLCLDGSSQIAKAFNQISGRLSLEQDFKFKPAKPKLYLRMSDEQAQNLPKNMKLHISVHLYGAFH